MNIHILAVSAVSNAESKTPVDHDVLLIQDQVLIKKD